MNKTQPTLDQTIELIKKKALELEEDRRKVLRQLITYVVETLNARKEVHLNFICTHNSRRSQFSQLWAQTAASYYNLNVHCYSGGVEVTAFNPRAVEAVKNAGFVIHSDNENDENPMYYVEYGNEHPLKMFSKLYDDPINSVPTFATVMTCAHADENCPVIPGAEARIPVRYQDPKKFDNTPLESEKYMERLLQIGAELFFVFQNVKKTIVA